MRPCPDLTPDIIDWLREYYPLPVWDGNPETAPEYHRRVGIWDLTQALAAQVGDEEQAEDAQSAL